MQRASTYFIPANIRAKKYSTLLPAVGGRATSCVGLHWSVAVRGAMLHEAPTSTLHTAWLTTDSARFHVLANPTKQPLGLAPRLFKHVAAATKKPLHAYIREGGGRPSVDYALTLDTAKELAMLEGNERGREIRRWFIEKEKELRQLQPQPLAVPQTQTQLILMIAQQMAAGEERLLAVEQQQATLQQQVAEVKAHVTTVNTDFFTVAGWASLQKKSVPTSGANALGRKAAALSKAQGYEIGKVSDARYGAVNSYHKDVLQQVIR